MGSIMLRKTPLFFWVLPLAWLVGCAGTSSVSQTKTAGAKKVTPIAKLIVDRDALLPDVPVPVGAKFKTTESSNYQTGSQRVVNHVYGIWAKPARVRLFYQENMPLRNWKPANKIASAGAQTLNYRKAKESCTITVGPRNWCFQTLIRIEIQPISN